MSICEEAPASAAGKGILLSKFNVAAAFGNIAAAFIARRNRRLVVSMRDFDDAQLADIGLSRHDVEKALRISGPDPTLHLMEVRRNPLKGMRHS